MLLFTQQAQTLLQQVQAAASSAMPKRKAIDLLSVDLGCVKGAVPRFFADTKRSCSLYNFQDMGSKRRSSELAESMGGAG